MHSYMHHGFSAHPAVAAQYLDFLVNSRGHEEDEKDSKVMKAVKLIEDKVNSVEKVAKEAKAAAGTANNGLTQLKAKVNNRT